MIGEWRTYIFGILLIPTSFVGIQFDLELFKETVVNLVPRILGFFFLFEKKIYLFS